MVEIIDNLPEVDSSEFVKERINNLEKSINSNNFETFMDAFRDYFKLEGSVEANGYNKKITLARDRIYELFYLSSFNKMKRK